MRSSNKSARMSNKPAQFEITEVIFRDADLEHAGYAAASAIGSDVKD